LVAHDVAPVVVEEVADDGNRFVCAGLCGDAGVVDYDLGVEYLLVDLLAEVVGDRADEFPLREVGDFRGRDSRSST
jgi:hypothetical protein